MRGLRDVCLAQTQCSGGVGRCCSALPRLRVPRPLPPDRWGRGGEGARTVALAREAAGGVVGAQDRGFVPGPRPQRNAGGGAGDACASDAAKGLTEKGRWLWRVGWGGGGALAPMGPVRRRSDPNPRTERGVGAPTARPTGGTCRWCLARGPVAPRAPSHRHETGPSGAASLQRVVWTRPCPVALSAIHWAVGGSPGSASCRRAGARSPAGRPWSCSVRDPENGPAPPGRRQGGGHGCPFPPLPPPPPPDQP